MNFRARITAVREGRAIDIASGENYVADVDMRWLEAVRRLVSLLKAGLTSQPVAS